MGKTKATEEEFKSTITEVTEQVEQLKVKKKSPLSMMITARYSGDMFEKINYSLSENQYEEIVKFGYLNLDARLAGIRMVKKNQNTYYNLITRGVFHEVFKRSDGIHPSLLKKNHIYDVMIYFFPYTYGSSSGYNIRSLAIRDITDADKLFTSSKSYGIML